MIRISVGDVARATGAALVAGDPSRVVEGVSLDSRKVGAGGLFVALPGERVDGNRYCASAARQGAAAVAMTSDPTPEDLAACAERGCAVLRVAEGDGESFMLRLAGEWRRRNPQWVVVGVTGSVGKTTTKEMLAAALSPGRRVRATRGNLNNLLGAPLTVLSTPAETDVLVVEMGMNHAGEISRIAGSARPNLAVITNVGTSHIGNLGSRENIARAKAEIVSGLVPPPGGGHATLVLNAEDDFTDFIADGFAAPAGVEVLRCGTSGRAQVRATDVTLDADGRASVEVSFPDGRALRASLPVPGRHMVADFLSAMTVAWALGCDLGASADAVAHMPQTHERLEVVRREGTPSVIDDSYNASPSSIAAALDVLCSMRCAGRRVAVLGEVGELGSEARRLHGYVGAYAAAKPLDLLVLVGSQDAAEMAEAARTMGFSEDRLEVFADVPSALEAMGPVLGSEDLVLVKASRAAGLDRFVEGVLAR